MQICFKTTRIMELRIKEVLAEKNTSLTELARISGIEKSNLSAIANGKKNPTVDTLEKIADGLGVRISHLFEKPNDGNFICPNCGTAFELEIKMTGDRK